MHVISKCPLLLWVVVSLGRLLRRCFIYPGFWTKPISFSLDHHRRLCYSYCVTCICGLCWPQGLYFEHRKIVFRSEVLHRRTCAATSSPRYTIFYECRWSSPSATTGVGARHTVLLLSSRHPRRSSSVCLCTRLSSPATYSLVIFSHTVLRAEARMYEVSLMISFNLLSSVLLVLLLPLVTFTTHSAPPNPSIAHFPTLTPRTMVCLLLSTCRQQNTRIVARGRENRMENARTVRPMISLAMTLFALASFQPALVRADDVLRDAVSAAFGTSAHNQPTIVYHPNRLTPVLSRILVVFRNNAKTAKSAFHHMPDHAYAHSQAFRESSCWL